MALKKDHSWVKQPKEPIVMTDEQNIRVLYEDNHIVAVNKRNSDIVQSDISGDATLCEVVKNYIRVKYNKPGMAFIGTVHRLDRPVSGVILYARTTKALNRLHNMFKFREVQKTYWAVVRNRPPKMEDTIVNYLKKNEAQNKSYCYDEPGEGRKESELRYKVIGHSNNYYFLEIYPKTGRHHQIRSTLASIGCPIKGDIKYFAKRTNKNASIHLHARQIEFVHPVKKTPLRITAPPPEDALWNEFVKIAHNLKDNNLDQD
ncbi:MAG: RluA family pseudouridine synthase [Flavobacteriales bacterium]|nr:RluA family pseudouridine synthase [Flavobacteriales bacterium]